MPLKIVAVFQLELVQAEKFRHYFCYHLQVFQIFNREKSFVNFQKLFMTAKVKIVAMKEIVIFWRDFLQFPDVQEFLPINRGFPTFAD